MERSKDIKYQVIKITVPSQGALVTVNTNSDKLYKNIVGILVSMPYQITFADSSTCNILINDKEIFPDTFEVKVIHCDTYIPVNERFYLLDEPADGSTVKIKLQDGAMAGVVYPYTANLYLKLVEKNQ
jgi:hypothetical protein